MLPAGPRPGRIRDRLPARPPDGNVEAQGAGRPIELRKKNPSVEGRRRHKHHQFLTYDTGIPHLDRQIASVTTLMRASSNKEMFNRLLVNAFPKLGEQLLIPVFGAEGDAPAEARAS